MFVWQLQGKKEGNVSSKDPTLRSVWQSQKSFTSPDPNNTNSIFIVPINDTKRRVNDLSQMFGIELRYDTAAQRVCAQPLDPGYNLGNKPLPHIRHAFAQVIGLQVLKVFDR